MYSFFSSLRTLLPYSTILTIGIYWLFVNIGYYYILPLVGASTSYNTSPLTISAYYFSWFLIFLYLFRDLLRESALVDTRIWHYGVVSLFFGTSVWALLYALAQFPTPFTTTLPAYTDILFSTPMYFLPKAFEIVVQQILLTVLIFALAKHLHSLRKVSLWYAIIFGSSHIILYSLNGAPAPYAYIMTGSALLTSLLFPYLIVRIRSGFVYSYMFQLLFYIALALILHEWPPSPFPAL